MWREKIAEAVEELPENWMNSVLDKINGNQLR
jgi:hypothetical protein